MSDLNSSDPGWRLCLLGEPRLASNDGARAIGLSPKDAALLGMVALAGPIHTERLARLIWPHVTERQADSSLRQRVFRLRRDTGAIIVSSGATLQLHPAVTTDLAAALVELQSDPTAARAELFGDHDYDDLPELAELVRLERRRWQEQRDSVLAGAAAACERDGALAQGLAYAQRLLDSDPLAEHARRRAMRLHYLRGDHAAAIAEFERFEQRLKDELGTRPSAETIELLVTIERGAAILPTRRSVVPASLLRPPRLIGRDRELSAMHAAWAADRIFLLIGEAGIGKSRLLHDFAAGETGTIRVQARPGDAGIPYALLARLLRAVLSAHPPAPDAQRSRELALVLPELGPAVDLAGQARRLLLQRTVEATLTDAVALGVRALLVDDLHFGDDASIELLQVLLESDALGPVRWGFAQRPSEGGAPAAALRAALEDTQRLEGVVLAALDVAQLRALVESIGLAELDAVELAPALLRHTGGNPLFVLETLKDMVLRGEGGSLGANIRLPQPITVGALVARRLTQLSAPALKLARVAALAGANFDAELAADVLELHPLDMAEPWRELEAAHVIRDGVFAHDLIFEATRSSVPEPIARLLHQRLAIHLQARHGEPARIAPHWAGAHEWVSAGEAYAAAARLAQSASQRSHEVEYWRLAAEAFDHAGQRERAFDVRCDSIHSLIVVHGVTHAHGVIDTLLAGAQSDRETASALIARATASLMGADHAVGIAAAAKAGELARTFDSPWPGFEAARLQAVGLAQGGRAVEGLAIIEPYRPLIERDATLEQRGRFWGDYAYVLNVARRLRDTDFALQQAIANAQAQGDLAELATLNSNLATVKGNLGQVSEALELTHRALALHAEIGATDGPGGAAVETYAGLYCMMVGRYREALARFDSALQRFARDRQVLWIAVASNHKAQCLIDLGQFARARQALDYERPSVEGVRVRGATMAARLARAMGQSGDAQLQSALAALGPGTDPHVRMHTLLDAAPGDDPVATMQRCDEVLAISQQLEFAGVTLKARLLHTAALSRSGRTADAATAMHGLVAQIPRVQPADFYFAQAWWIAAQVFDAHGDGDDALIALAQGAKWVRRVALPNVPEEFQDSFLHRNPTNRALLAAADRATR